jgi:O-antigen ligase
LYGIPQLLNHPFFGLGMGALYRPFISKIDGYGNMGPHYTHNGHLWIAMKGGLFAWLALMAFLIIFIVQGLKKWRQVTDPSMQSLALGFSLVGLSVIIASILHPIIITLFWTPLLGIIFGINHVIFKLYTGETETVQTEALPAEYQT